jgi:hypothetical protein
MLIWRGHRRALAEPGVGLRRADPGDAIANGTRVKVATGSAADPGMDWRLR